MKRQQDTRYHEYITVKEAVALRGRQFIGPINAGRDIFDACLTAEIRKRYDVNGNVSLAAGATFHAGYIAGVRAERARRKPKHYRGGVQAA